MMRVVISAIFLFAATFSAFAGNATEVQQTSPEVSETPKTEQGESPSAKSDDGVADNQGSDTGVADDSPMTVARLGEIARALDKDASVQGNGILVTLADVRVTVIADPKNNRMRAFSAFQTLDGVDGQQMYRMMQANFDAALDARYAIAKGYLISVFIHPLAELQKDQFIEALGQVVNLVKTYGSSYTSGAMTFGGGDSNSLHRELIDDLLKKGERI